MLTPCAFNSLTVARSNLVSPAVRELVGSSSTRMRAVLRQCFGDFHQLLVGEGKLFQRGLRIDVQAQPFKMRPAVFNHRPAINQLQWPTPKRLAAEKQIGGDAQVVQVVQFLMDESYSMFHRLGDRADWTDGPSIRMLPSSG